MELDGRDPVMRVEANGVGLHCRVDGPAAAPVVLLLNPIASDLHIWDPQIPAFSSSLRVIRYDSRGHGASDVPPGPYTVEQLGADAIGLLDALDVERAHICGLSIGGLTALWLAARCSERLERAVFASTAGKIGTSELWDKRVEAARREGMAAVREGHVARFFTESFRRGHPEAVRSVVRSLEATPPEGYVGSCLAVRDADLTTLAAAIPVPSLVLGGRKDVATPPAEAERLHARIPGSKLVLLDDAAHLCNLERPALFTEAVLGFLRGA